MNVSQALEHANAFSFAGFLVDDASLTDERRKNEEAITLLTDAWMSAPKGSEAFSFDLVRGLADRNREVCDTYGEKRLRDIADTSLARKLSNHDIVRGVAKLQHRREVSVRKSAGNELNDLNIALMEAPLTGTVLGIDLETTGRFPDRGYIINVGFAMMELAENTEPHDGYSLYFGLPEAYEGKPVPLAEIHHITSRELTGKLPFRKDTQAQKNLLRALTVFPLMAHNAAFEDSWLLLHLDGYAEAKKAGKITIVDSRELCRRLDPDVRALPHDSKPTALESWARRRGTLQADEKERHLGLDDVVLMLKTAQAELSLRGLLRESQSSLEY